MTSTTLRLNMPQWQGGNEPAYRFGAELLAFLAPPADGPEETIDVPYPDEGATLETDAGIVGRAALLSQARAARAAIDRHSPERILALGGDCLIDLAPIAYLNERYGGKLGVLWVDSHPDVTRPEHFSHAHAHVLGMLMGEGDPDFLILAEIDGVLVGSVNVKRMGEGFGEFCILVADRNCRGQGIGSALVKHAERWAANTPVTASVLRYSLPALDTSEQGILEAVVFQDWIRAPTGNGVRLHRVAQDPWPDQHVRHPAANEQGAPPHPPERH